MKSAAPGECIVAAVRWAPSEPNDVGLDGAICLPDRNRVYELVAANVTNLCEFEMEARHLAVGFVRVAGAPFATPYIYTYIHAVYTTCRPPLADGRLREGLRRRRRLHVIAPNCIVQSAS